jgi:hypothetical protein
MNRLHIGSLVIGAAMVFSVGIAFAVQDRYTLKSSTGLSFSEFRGYERWQMIGSTMSDAGVGCGSSPDPGCIKSVLGNPAMIKAYADGFPANGKSVPDGAAFVKIEWAKARDTTAGYAMIVPGNLAEVAFMVKDSKRFPRTDGWGYATFQYDAAKDDWKPKSDPNLAAGCHACHTLVKKHDFVFTHYAKR